MGNSASSHRHEIIVDYDDLLGNDSNGNEEQSAEAQESEILIDEAPREQPSEIESQVPIIEPPVEGNEDGGLIVDISPVVKSLVSIIPESLVALPDDVSEQQEPPKPNKISLEKTDDTQEPQEAKQTRNNIQFPQSFSILFSVDTETECTINIIWGAKEDRKSKRTFSSRFSKGEYSCELPASLNQRISISSSDIPTFTSGDARFLTEGAQYQPLLIQLISNEPNLVKDSALLVQEQLVYASFEKNNGDNGPRWSLGVDKIAVVYNDHEYIVHDLYGTGSDEPDGNECVICMTDEPTTTLLPCRHMCLCNECTGLFRTRTEKCPICRSRVLNMLRTV